MINPDDWKEFYRYIKDAEGFVERIINVARIDPWQRKFLKSLSGPKKRIWLAGGHGVGKDTVEAWAILWFLCTRYYPKIPVYSPSQSQIDDCLWPECHKWIQHSEIVKGMLTWKSRRIELTQAPERWFASPVVAAKKVTHETGEKFSEGGAGRHADHLLYIITEGSGVDGSYYQTADASLGNEDSLLVAAGNPLRTAGEFAQISTDPRFGKDWEKFNISMFDSSFVDHEEARSLILKYGEESSYVQARVYGRVPSLSAPDVCLAWDAVTEAMHRDVSFIASDDLQIGVDVARYGDCETVYACRRGWKIAELLEERKTPGPHIVGRICELMTKWRPKTGGKIILAIDESGMGGSGVVDPLREIDFEKYHELKGLKISIVGVNNGSRAKNPIKYVDRVSEMWLEDISSMLPRLSLPYDEALLQQLSTRKYRFTGKGIQRRIQTKDEIMQKGKPSPDRADAVVLACSDTEVQVKPIMLLGDVGSMRKEVEEEWMQRQLLHQNSLN